MQTRALGKTGHDVTAVGFGAWAIGGLGYGDQNEQDAYEAIETYLNAGGRLIDTARGYGISEILIGKRLRALGLTEEVFLASKSGKAHPPAMKADLETSIFCLGRERIELYYIHVPPGEREKLDALLDTYAECRTRGRTRLVGVSCKKILSDGTGLDEAMRYVEDDRVDVIQVNYSYAQPRGGEVIAAAAAAGKGVVARSNMLGGLLSGKYRPGHRFGDPANQGRAHIDPENLDRLLAVVREIEEQLLRPPYENMVQLALAYALANPNVSAIIPGGRSREQVAMNLSVDALPPMDADLVEQLEAAGEEIGRLREGRAR